MFAKKRTFWHKLRLAWHKYGIGAVTTGKWVFLSYKLVISRYDVTTFTATSTASVSDFVTEFYVKMFAKKRTFWYKLRLAWHKSGIGADTPGKMGIFVILYKLVISRYDVTTFTATLTGLV